jgi:hypothetical protein
MRETSWLRCLIFITFSVLTFVLLPKFLGGTHSASEIVCAEKYKANEQKGRVGQIFTRDQLGNLMHDDDEWEAWNVVGENPEKTKKTKKTDRRLDISREGEVNNAPKVVLIDVTKTEETAVRIDVVNKTEDTTPPLFGWCQPNAVDVALTRALIAPNPASAGSASNTFAFVLTPMVSFVSALSPIFSRGFKELGWPQDINKNGIAHAGQDTIIIIGAALTSLGINNVVKTRSWRPRPCFYYGDEDATEAADAPEEEFLSFFSGASTFAFVTYHTGLTLAKIRRRTYASNAHDCSCICAVSVGGLSPMAFYGGLFAVLGSLLRVVAYMHWFSDVLVGALFGSLLGCGLPLLLFADSEVRSFGLATLATKTPKTQTSDVPAGDAVAL